MRRRLIADSIIQSGTISARAVSFIAGMGDADTPAVKENYVGDETHPRIIFERSASSRSPEKGVRAHNGGLRRISRHKQHNAADQKIRHLLSLFNKYNITS